MIVVDANLLIYAVNEDAPAHQKAKSWLEAAVSGTETVGLPWIVLLAFLRLTTRPGLFQKPMSVDAAFEVVDAWLRQPSALPCPNLPRATCKRCVIWFRRWAREETSRRMHILRPSR